MAPAKPRAPTAHARHGGGSQPTAACLVLGLLAACGSAEGDVLARPTIDTLASGAVRVMNAAPTRWRDPASGWRFEQVWLTSGDEGTASELIEPQSLAVDGAGRVYVADRKPAVIKVYGADGRFIRTIGREGAGPGEFRVAFLAARGGHLVVHDPQASRTSVFDTAGAFLRSWHSACCYWTSIHMDREERIYIPSPWAGGGDSVNATWLRYRVDGTVIDTLTLPQSPSTQSRTWTVRSGSGGNRMVMMTPVPFSPRLISTFDPDGRFLAGWSEDYVFAVTPTGRDTIQVFGRAWTPDPVPEQARRDTVDSMVSRMSRRGDPAAFRSAFRVEDIPATAPAFMGVQVSEDDHRWVRLGAAPEGGMLYDVFDPDGAWLGPVRVPVSFSPWDPQHWGAGDLVVAVIDDDGLPALVRYRTAGGASR